MGLLTEKLPESIEIAQKTYLIGTDFRIWIKFSQTAFLREMDMLSFVNILALIFRKETGCPPANEETVKAILDFANPFKTDSTKNGSSGSRKQIYDFELDEKYIYSSFMQQYGINLTKADLHWWEFKALFDGLSADTPFGKIVEFRSKDISKVKDKEMKKYYVRMQKLYALPDNRCEEEKEKDFADNFGLIF